MASHGKPWWDSWANSWPEEKHGVIASANSDTQLALIPCFPPLNGRARLLQYYFSNSSASAAVVNIFDSYLNDPTGFTTSGVVGSASAPVWRVNVPGSADVMAACNTQKAFQTGIAAQSTATNMFYSIQFAVTALG
jgi:hypothetical protein